MNIIKFAKKQNMRCKPLFGTEKLQIEREIEFQKYLRINRTDDCLSVNYSVPIFRRRPPEVIEAKWKADIEKLKQMLAEYAQRLEEEKSHQIVRVK